MFLIESVTLELQISKNTDDLNFTYVEYPQIEELNAAKDDPPLASN